MVNDRLGLLTEVADAVADSLEGITDRGPSGRRVGQYALDVRADDAALAVLARAGVGVLSEESGYEPGGSGLVVIIDPVDGSTNASRGVPWYACSLCLFDADGPLTSLVVNLASGERFWAERGGGAWHDGVRLAGSGCTTLSEAILGLNGIPSKPIGSAQVRMFGASALDLCLVASGTLDGYVDCVIDAHGVWDYAGASLVCAEAGVPIVDAHGRDLIVFDHDARRTPVAASTPELLEALLQVRRTL